MRRKLRLSRCWPIRHGAACRRTFHRPPGQRGRQSWAKSAMRRLLFTTEHTKGTEEIKGLFTTETQRHREEEKNHTEPGGRLKSRYHRNIISRFPLCLCVSVVLFFAGCSRKPDPNTLVMIIESSPTNLDPR